VGCTHHAWPLIRLLLSWQGPPTGWQAR